MTKEKKFTLGEEVRDEGSRLFVHRYGGLGQDYF